MDEMYGLQSTGDECDDRALMSPENLILPAEYYYHQYNCHSTINDNDPAYDYQHRIIPAVFGSEELGFHGGSVVSESASVNVRNQREGDEDEKAKIVSHPCYPKLLDAYIDCQKVGAPPELVSLLDEIRREKDSVFSKQDGATMSAFGVDPELDEFMETYCDILVKYKTDLSKPFDEATSFLNKIEAKLSNLCNDENGGLSSDEEEEQEQEQELRNHGEIEIQGQSQDQQLIKEKLLRRYGSQINSLKHEFSKKKKKGKLPKEAKQNLLHWWNLHSKWPYPTEPDKIGLAEATGLDQKQINNWFINQRKRHWKSPETTFMSPNAGHNFNFNSQQ